jgi:predicted negative regulator of RcsB-dependent stress response
MANKELGNINQAERDLTTSQRLLPTEDAAEGLGDIALAKGDRRTAASYYTQVVNGGGANAERAKSKLAKIQFQ